MTQSDPVGFSAEDREEESRGEEAWFPALVAEWAVCLPGQGVISFNLPFSGAGNCHLCCTHAETGSLGDGGTGNPEYGANLSEMAP